MWPFGRKLTPPDPMQLRLRDLNFGIESATLGAGLVDPYWAAKYDTKNPIRLNWSLSIECKELEKGGEFWAPAVSHDSLQPAIARWTDWPGQVFQWSRRHDAVTGKPNGGFYIFEHADIPRGRLEFMSRNGIEFEIAWSGACDVHWNWKYGRSVPFALKATVRFTNIWVHGSERDTDATVRDRLAQFISLDALTQRPLEFSGHRYQDGVAMASCVFEPKLSAP